MTSGFYYPIIKPEITPIIRRRVISKMNIISLIMRTSPSKFKLEEIINEL